MIRYEHIEFLYALLSIPVFVLIFIIYRYDRKRKLRRIGDRALLAGLMPEVSSFKPVLKFTILMLALAFMLIAAANPQIGSKMEEIKREGVEVIIALDISNSMLAEDVKPSRLELARLSISKLIDNLNSDRIGLVLFAGDAYLQLPLTTDYSAAKLMLSTVSTGLIDMQGTAIGRALELSMKSFSKDETRNKAIILITDGENHEDDALSIAAEAAEQGIVIHTIGMGSIAGSPIPQNPNNPNSGYIKNESGETVISKLNANMLQQLAAIGGGRFIRASATNPNLTTLIEELAGMEKQEFGSRIYTDYEDRFQYFAAAALLLLILELFISEKRNKLVARLLRFVGGSK